MVLHEGQPKGEEMMSDIRPEALTEDEIRQLEGGLGGYSPKIDKLTDQAQVEAQGVDPANVSTPFDMEVVEEAVALRQGLGG